MVQQSGNARGRRAAEAGVRRAGHRGPGRARVLPGEKGTRRELRDTPALKGQAEPMKESDIKF